MEKHFNIYGEKKSQRGRKKIINFLMKNRLLPLFGSALFFIIYGIAFYIIFLDLDEAKKQLREDFNAQQLILARQSAYQFDSYLKSLEQEFKSLKLSSESEDTSIVNKSLEMVLNMTHNIGVIDAGICDMNGKIKYYLKSPEAEIINKNLLINELKRSKGLIKSMSHPVYLDSTRKSFNSLFLYKTNFSDSLNIAIFARIDLSYLFRRALAEVRSGKTGYAWAINENCIALYHPEKDFVGHPLNIARKEKMPRANFADINQIMTNKMIVGEEGSGLFETFWHRGIKGRQIEKLIAYSPVTSDFFSGNQIWSIAVVAPVSEVAEAVDQAYNRHLAAQALIIAGMCIFFTLILIYQRRVSVALKRQVSEQEKYISSILDNTYDAIIFTDKENIIQVWNKGAENLFGYTAEEMQGHSFRRLIPQDVDAAEEMQKIQKKVSKKGYISQYVAPRLTRSGNLISANISRTLVVDNKGNTIGNTVIIRDDTERSAFDQRIYHTEKLASLGTMAAGVAHEINNPLAVILGYVDLMLDDIDPNHEYYKDLKTIEVNANNAKKIVENMLGFARVTEGETSSTNIENSIHTVVNVVKNTLITKKIQLDITIVKNLPYVKGDPREFQQVIFNLINNSMAAMKGKGGKLIIKSWKDDQNVFVSIADTGNGIPNRIKNNLFDPFFTTKDPGEGTGLGLSLSYGIINKCGGNIIFSSCSKEDHPERQSGTTFTITLPIDMEDVE